MSLENSSPSFRRPSSVDLRSRISSTRSSSVPAVMNSWTRLNVARETFATVLQASTSGVYGDPEICPQNENYRGRVDCIGAQSCYEEGNRAAETLFFNYHRQYQADIRVIRIFDTYGPHMAHNGVVSNF